MRPIRVSESGPLRGKIRVPGDKSISHRALLLGAIAGGNSEITGFLPCNDCLATLACIRALGIEVTASVPERRCACSSGSSPPNRSKASSPETRSSAAARWRGWSSRSCGWVRRLR